MSGGFRSDAGAEAHAIVSPVVDTARKRGEDVFGTLQGHLGSPAPVGVQYPLNLHNATLAKVEHRERR